MGTEEFYASLRQKLEETNQYPVMYMFKFIVPTLTNKAAEVTALFGKDANITSRQSSNGKFTSITVRLVMLSSDEIIEKYQQVGKIEGVIML
ncbi:DUF493 domain-containing protein [Microscilla marina]|uniref:DUF493 domain-containing protein n=1 Tax=Microscilla marina ATCC 23134 TaxID=313606 RepID=A1ZX92_MICM2|nr:DUF493 domain-containing protein [Microscilla marina]EAY24966.1 conserved hypothetical protein [Microscilla marina ATCC 23134]